jgi:hypothetical protein
MSRSSLPISSSFLSPFISSIPGDLFPALSVAIVGWTGMKMDKKQYS